MTTPAIADDEPDLPAVAETGEPPATTDDAPAHVEEVELGSNDYGGDDLFDDVEDAEGTDDGDGEDGDPFDLDGATGGLEDAINDGAARLAVLGLEGDEQTELEDEFQEVFGAFRLGHFAALTTEEYVLSDREDEIDPAWGLLGSALVCGAVVMCMRPDGDEQIERMKEAVGGASA